MSLLLRQCKYVISPLSLHEIAVYGERDILIENGVIECFAKHCDAPRGIDIIDCREFIAMPALGNAHTHAAMVALRGYADDYELFEWLERVWQAEKLLSRDVVYFATLIGCIEMAMSGIGAFQDMYFFPDEVVRAALKIGLRVRTGPIVGIDNLDMKRWKALESSSNGMFNTVINLHSLYGVDMDLIEKAFELSKTHSIDIHMHISETRREVFEVKRRFGKLPIEFLESRGWLSPRLIAVHLNWVTTWELDYIARAKVRVVVNPTSGAKLAVGGFAPLREMLERGIDVGLGTDGACSSNRLSILREMRMLVLLYRHNYWDTWIRASHALYIATRGSYGVMKIRGGVIEPGAVGDIVLIDLKTPWLYPTTPTRLVSHIVYALEQSNIRYTIVNGRVVWSPETSENLVKLFLEATKHIDRYIDKIEELREDVRKGEARSFTIPKPRGEQDCPQAG
ncbi:MAG TPA: amidohydrolase [Ignisphaera aggregans]|uniref:Amidohydrolase n=1 Tax=Ignisphaera aggregans TaxID=334771 RepID=A0A832YZ82_9CREN|nr:amidohydrolase [Ignisphaera aggregans]